MNYRELTSGETLEEGDEVFDVLNNEWLKIGTFRVGFTPSILGMYRRPIKERPTVKEVQQPPSGWIEIKSEADLPKDNATYPVIYKGHKQPLGLLNGQTIRFTWKEVGISHYLQYPDPPPPVNEDEEAFKLAYKDIHPKMQNQEASCKQAWLAALEYERKKQKT
jgi:hypothetical protein